MRTVNLCKRASVALAQEIPDDFRKDIVKLMETTGASKLGEQIGNAVAQQAVADMRAQNPDVAPRAIEMLREVTTSYVSKFINSPRMMDAFVPLYAKHFTHDEIKTVIAFYETPTGQKLVRTLPELTAESRQTAQREIQTIIPDMQATLQQKLSAKGLSLH